MIKFDDSLKRFQTLAWSGAYLIIVASYLNINIKTIIPSEEALIGLCFVCFVAFAIYHSRKSFEGSVKERRDGIGQEFQDASSGEKKGCNDAQSEYEQPMSNTSRVFKLISGIITSQYLWSGFSRDDSENTESVGSMSSSVEDQKNQKSKGLLGFFRYWIGLTAFQFQFSALDELDIADHSPKSLQKALINQSIKLILLEA